jgi:hypothetical protein
VLPSRPRRPGRARAEVVLPTAIALAFRDVRLLEQLRPRFRGPDPGEQLVERAEGDPLAWLTEDFAPAPPEHRAGETFGDEARWSLPLEIDDVPNVRRAWARG